MTTVVFDISRQTFWSWPAVIALALGVGGAALSRRSRDSSAAGVTGADWRSAAILIGGIAVATFIAAMQYRQFSALRHALARGDYLVVEGVVRNYVPDNDYGQWESFDVGGHRYEYAWAVEQYGYHDTAPHGGVIREGLHVRIADVDGVIARLEVRPP